MKTFALRALSVAALLLVGTPALATKLRHPLTNGKQLGTGLDHGGKDYNCGGRFYSGHHGNDYPTPVGSQVVAAADGVVTTVVQGCADTGSLGNTCGGQCGNHVRIKHADGMSTVYCHMKNGSMSVSVGQQVSCGQGLGLSASSGSSTGPHLHMAWRPPTGADRDPYVGNCSPGTTGWVQQGSYNEVPSASCECAASPEVCDGLDNDCDGTVDEDEVCERDRLIDSPILYAPPSTTDIDGDGRADVCGRGGAGILCHRAADGFTTGAEELLVPLSNDNGWNDPTNFATLRMGDVDGDGRADLCARSNASFQCWTSKDKPLSQSIVGPAWSDESGWGATQYFTTIRLLDLDGDGREDVCARAAKGIVCHLSSGDGFGPEIAGPGWSDAAGFASAKYYGTLRTGDVNGDGRDDLCIRAAKGMVCVPSTEDGFGEPFDGPAWSDAAGWGNPMYYGSIRLADVDGNGKADLCARSSTSLVCHFSTGTGFGEARVVAPLADAQGWNDPGNYLPLRTGDVDRDGAEDLCVRANARVICYAFHNDTFDAIEGPTWADEHGWNVPQYYETLRLGDLDGDGRFDLCARAAAGFVCARSLGSSFEDGKTVAGFADAQGWAVKPYYNTLMFASPRCRPEPETCNQLDDDCDGEIDEGDVCESTSTGGSSSMAGASGAAAGGAGSEPKGGSAGTSGQASAGLGGAPSSSTGGQAGQPSGSAPKRIPGADEEDSGACACRHSGQQTDPTRGVLAGALGLSLLVARRRQRARPRS